jgi:GTP-binding protein Era
VHKAGFVNIIGKPNVGKSTLLNALIGEKLSIITHKPQTTRHRILAIINEDNYQVVFSDTPGIIEEPGYKMQNAMNRSAYSTLEDADVLLFMTEIDDHPAIEAKLVKRISDLEVPVFLILNKIDLVNDLSKCKHHIETWSQMVKFDKVFMISALKEQNTSKLLNSIIESLPESPPYYPKDQFTDRSELFFVSEIIPEKILLLYHQEIPYSCEIMVESFKDKESKKGPMQASL